MNSETESSYIFDALNTIEKSGNAYTSADCLFNACVRKHKGLHYPEFSAALSDQIAAETIYRDGPRLYTPKTWQLEEKAAETLKRLPTLPPLPAMDIPETLEFDGFTLFPEQRDAVATALSNRLSIILGGAGSGKTTLIRAIVSEFNDPKDCVVLCAPTGKAARHLGAQTKLGAKTIHSTLKMFPGGETVDTSEWNSVRLLVVDEASMMTLEMLAKILSSVPDICHVVLVGDRKQLLSVGPGNVLDDLLDLGVPVSRLKCNHRQSGNEGALKHNVVEFGDLHSLQDLHFDDSFSLAESSSKDVLDAIAQEAASRYLAGESVQVLAPFRRTVRDLNKQIREQVNPKTGDMLCIGLPNENDIEFRDGDRVIITKNDKYRDCCNGDVGILRIGEDDEGLYYTIELPDGRNPTWIAGEIADGLSHLELAYAMTVHKAQGSEYDTVLFPLLPSARSTLSRNLFYTAISRAKKRVLLYGSKQAIDAAMHKELPPRNSTLVEKTKLLMKRAAA